MYNKGSVWTEKAGSVCAPIGRKLRFCMAGYYLWCLASTGGLWNVSLTDKGGATVIVSFKALTVINKGSICVLHFSK